MSEQSERREVLKRAKARGIDVPRGTPTEQVTEQLRAAAARKHAALRSGGKETPTEQTEN